MKIEHGREDNRTFVGYADTFKEANKLMTSYLKEIDYKSYYQRMTFDKDEWWVDYGSWSNFFWISELPEGASYESYCKEMKE